MSSSRASLYGLKVLMVSTRSHRPLSDEALGMIAARFKILSETLRLRLVQELQQGERSVGDLVQATGKTQTNVSRQLQTLADAGILARRKEGVSVYYRITDPAIFELCQHVCGSLQRELAQKAETSKLFSP